MESRIPAQECKEALDARLSFLSLLSLLSLLLIDSTVVHHTFVMLLFLRLEGASLRHGHIRRQGSGCSLQTAQ